MQCDYSQSNARIYKQINHRAPVKAATGHGLAELERFGCAGPDGVGSTELEHSSRSTLVGGTRVTLISIEC